MNIFISFILLHQLFAAGPLDKKEHKVIKDTQVSSIEKVSLQADAIIREALWVANKERPTREKTPFGKVHRAMLLDQGGKISNKGIFSCDRYIVKKNYHNEIKYPSEYEVSQKCQVKENEKLLVQINVAQKNHYQYIFHSENLSDVLGLASSLFGKKIECLVESNQDDIIQNLKCQNWQQDRGEGKIVKFDTFEYQANDKNLLKIRGQILENLAPVQKIEADVPLQGKITVTETVLNPPIVEKPKVVDKKVKPEVKQKKDSELNQSTQQNQIEHENPDLIQHQIQQMQQPVQTGEPDYIEQSTEQQSVPPQQEQPPAGGVSVEIEQR